MAAARADDDVNESSVNVDVKREGAVIYVLDNVIFSHPPPLTIMHAANPLNSSMRVIVARSFGDALYLDSRGHSGPPGPET